MELHGHRDPKQLQRRSQTNYNKNYLLDYVIISFNKDELQQKSCGHDGSDIAHDHRMGRDCHNGLQFVLYVAVPSTYAGIIYLHWAFQTMLPAGIA